MRILITGICGFAGSTIARRLLESTADLTIAGLDNFCRAGSRLNLDPLQKLGIDIIEGDIRFPEDIARVGAVDWILDAAANPSVLAGVDGKSTSRDLVDHNLGGTINLLEHCREHGAGFTLLSTSRVYSIPMLCNLSLVEHNNAFAPAEDQEFPIGISASGVTETAPTSYPISLYGATKLASETIALEYGATFGFPVFINRCGVLAGAGQFGRADQGIFSYWLHAWHSQRPLRYIGFDGLGHQVRDCLHPDDLVPVLKAQMIDQSHDVPRVVNFGGGTGNSMSLRQLSEWCSDRFGAQPVEADPQPRRFDVPWVVMDSSLAKESWNWRPQTKLEAILEEIAEHAEKHPDWLDVTGG